MKSLATPEQMTAALFELLRKYGPIEINVGPDGVYRLEGRFAVLASRTPNGVRIELGDLSQLPLNEQFAILLSEGRAAARPEFSGGLSLGHDPATCPNCQRMQSLSERERYETEMEYRQSRSEVGSKIAPPRPEGEVRPHIHRKGETEQDCKICTPTPEAPGPATPQVHGGNRVRGTGPKEIL